MMRMVPENRGVVQGTIHGVRDPYGVAVSNSGEVVMSEFYSHRISVYSREGKHIRSFGIKGSNKGQFQHPHGVAITSDNLPTSSLLMNTITESRCLLWRACL